MPSKQTELRE